MKPISTIELFQYHWPSNKPTYEILPKKLKPDIYCIVFGPDCEKQKEALAKWNIPILFQCRAFNAQHDNATPNRLTLIIFDIPEDFKLPEGINYAN